MAQWPTSVSTDANLYLAVGSFSTTLNGAADNVQTTITLTSTSGLPTVGILLIETEKVKYTGVSGSDITGCTRGFGGSIASSHPNSSTVTFIMAKEHHNALKDEIEAIEQNLSDRIGLDTGSHFLGTGSLMTLDTGGNGLVEAAANNFLALGSSFNFEAYLELHNVGQIRLGVQSPAPYTATLTVQNPGQLIYIANSVNMLDLHPGTHCQIGENGDSFIAIDPLANGGKIHITPAKDLVLVDKTHSTGDNDGFVLLPGVGGTPVGTPTLSSNDFPILYDTGADKLWVYNGTTWKSIALV